MVQINKAYDDIKSLNETSLLQNYYDTTLDMITIQQESNRKSSKQLGTTNPNPQTASVDPIATWNSFPRCRT
jgi:hypothetical protein